MKKNRTNFIRRTWLLVVLLLQVSSIGGLIGSHLFVQGYHFSRDYDITLNMAKRISSLLNQGIEIDQAMDEVIGDRANDRGFQIVVIDANNESVWESSILWDRSVARKITYDGSDKLSWQRFGALGRPLNPELKLLLLFDIHPFPIFEIINLEEKKLTDLPIIAAISYFLIVNISILCGFYFSYKLVVKRVQVLAEKGSKSLSEIQQGNLSKRIESNDSGPIALVVHSFNKMADQLEITIKKLSVQEQTLRELIQELAHDLKTPIASLSMIIEDLEKKNESMGIRERRQRLDLLGREISYFRRLIEDLLFLSGLVSGASPKRQEIFNVSSIIMDVAEIIEDQGQDISIICSTELELSGDPFLFRRLIRNLLQNGARYAKNFLEVEVTESGNNLVLYIRDDGPGFAKEELESFGQKRRSRRVEMTADLNISLGLGSVIARNIALSFGGELKVRNRVSGGAEVEILIPGKIASTISA